MSAKIKKFRANNVAGEENLAEQSKDPNLTLDVKNPAVEEMLKNYAAERTPENLNKLIERLRVARILVPATINEKKQASPCQLKGSDGGMYVPVYTSKANIPEKPKMQAILNMPYLAINQLAAKDEAKLSGVVVNPFTNNLILKANLVKRIEEVEKMRANGGKKTMKLTEPQYRVFERGQFEFKFLPRHFFDGGKEFIDAVSDGKEEYIDGLFEESYQQKRMYPYLPEDFSVIVMGISEELTLVRLDMPNRDMGNQTCWRIYMAWNEGTGRGRYFTIERVDDGKSADLCEISSDGKHIRHGESPVEGAELQRVVDMVQETESC